MGNSKNHQGILIVEGKSKFSLFFLWWGNERKSWGGRHKWDHIWIRRKKCDYLFLGLGWKANNEDEWFALHYGMYLLRKISIAKIIVIGDSRQVINKWTMEEIEAWSNPKESMSVFNISLGKLNIPIFTFSEAIMLRWINWKIKELIVEWGWPR